MCLSIEVNHPEVVLKKGTSRGFEWVIVHNHLGFRCGYVRIPKGHPWHGLDHDNVPAQAHGGLTFAQPDMPCAKGGADDAWWIGFDCAHWNDAQDPKLPAEFRYPSRLGGTIRTTKYVESECKSLISQALQAQPKTKK